MTSKRPLPSDNDVRLLLGSSRSNPDPRSSAAITLLLTCSITPCHLDRLKWSQLDVRLGTLVLSKRRGEEKLTELTIRQLLAIAPSSASGKIFGATDQFPQSLNSLLASTLKTPSLSAYTINDFVRWSRLQSDSVRLSIATAVKENR
jgi:hypothetical protein